MGNDFYHKLGAAFMFIAACIYTVERFGNKLAGLPANEAGFFSNLFVPIFSFIGILLFVFAFPSSRR